MVIGDAILTVRWYRQVIFVKGEDAPIEFPHAALLAFDAPLEFKAKPQIQLTQQCRKPASRRLVVHHQLKLFKQLHRRGDFVVRISRSNRQMATLVIQLSLNPEPFSLQFT
ncbi:MAG: hypothetical protein H6817_10985 [Phycisphaerales bacterium]|nr:hypothetical protein [Phycisphaerales bacterium]